MRRATGLLAAACVALAGCATTSSMVPLAASPPLPAVETLTIADLARLQATGAVTSETLVGAYVARIEALDRSGPTLRSVIAIAPDAVAEARALDAERAAGRTRGPLHGVPVLIKDNIETRSLPTTAGSLALAANATGRDAPLVARLREAGAVVLGVTNLSEWANYRSTRSISGWSAIGGLTRNPHALDRNTSGSSSGSGVAAAAGLAAATVGTETSGSIVSPAAVNGIVGLKPTVGLVSRRGVVPIAASMDTAGPMARTVADAAALLTVLAGTDPGDPATDEADRRKVDYVAALSTDGLKGRRLGVLRLGTGVHPDLDALFEAALADLRAAGAEVVDVSAPADFAALGAHVGPILSTEFKVGVEAYLATAAPAVATRTLADLIAFNAARADAEMPLFGQELFEQAAATKGLSDPAYVAARAAADRLSRAEGIDRMLAAQRLDALVSITAPPAWPTDVAGASRSLAIGAPTLIAALAGYPHLTVPMGAVRGLPAGLSFVGPAWSEARLLSMGHAFEQAGAGGLRRRVTPRFLPSLSADPAVTRALTPSS